MAYLTIAAKQSFFGAVRLFLPYLQEREIRALRLTCSWAREVVEVCARDYVPRRIDYRFINKVDYCRAPANAVALAARAKFLNRTIWCRLCLKPAADCDDAPANAEMEEFDDLPLAGRCTFFHE